MKKTQRDHLNLLCNISDLASLLTGSENIRSFLQRTAVMVSQHLNADVCSIYLYNEQSGEIVLKATIGLNPEAVNKVKMKPGEGLVGTVMENLVPICEASAVNNPKFKYFAEAQEERFESFLAVPIHRGVEKIGVLTVQHETENYFDDLDVMALRAIASQLAGAIENARLLMNLDHPNGFPSTKPTSNKPQFIKGKSGSGGYAFAPSKQSDRYHELLNNETDSEALYTLEQFHNALDLTLNQLKELQERFSESLPESASLIFTAHFMILKDARFINEITKKIQGGVNPPEAIKQVARHYISKFSSSSHAYIREKVNDMEDLAIRILGNLRNSDAREHAGLNNCVVISSRLYPSDILKLASEGVKGIVLVSGGTTSHVSILTRSINLPMVIADRPELLNLPEHTPVLLDADIGNVYINPSETIIQQFENRNAAQKAAGPTSVTMSPATETKDRVRIHLLANINLLSELPLVKKLHAEGIGLYRTEFPFLIRSQFPSEEEQYVIYQRLFDEMEDTPITIRTLDIGGDKILPYSDAARETNPDMGLKSIRFSLYHKDIFEQQIRAILRAACRRNQLNVMFPMISSLDEFREARQVVLDSIDHLHRSSLPHFSRPEIGMMLEVPSVLSIIHELLDEADFVSIGTNDFIQYMLAVDRTNEKVAKYYRSCHPSVLRGLDKIVKAALDKKKTISICGEMAHEIEYIPFLIGIGIRQLSVAPQFLPKVQDFISGLMTTEAEQYAETLLSKATIKEIQNEIIFSRLFGIR